MNRRFPRRLPLLTAACLAATLATSTVASMAHAGVIEADLQQAMQNGGDIEFIVQFSDQLDLSTFPGKGKGKGNGNGSGKKKRKGQSEGGGSDSDYYSTRGGNGGGGGRGSGY